MTLQVSDLKRAKKAELVVLVADLLAERERLKGLALEMDASLNKVAAQRDSAMRQVAQANAQYQALRVKLDKAFDWVGAHAPLVSTSLVYRAMREWLTSSAPNSGFGVVHPFDRWDIRLPKP